MKTHFITVRTLLLSLPHSQMIDTNQATIHNIVQLMLVNAFPYSTLFYVSHSSKDYIYCDCISDLKLQGMSSDDTSSTFTQ